MSIDKAFELAMENEGFDIPDGDDSEFADSSQPSEPCRDSFPEIQLGEDEDDEEFDASRRRKRHPSVALTQACRHGLCSIESMDLAAESYLSSGTRGAGDMVGGSVLATSSDWSIQVSRALAIPHLKPALRGHAFARCAVFDLSSTGAIDAATADRLHQQLEQLWKSTHHSTARARDEDADGP